MKWLLALVATASIASAAPIAPPAGWQLDPALAGPPAAQRFGGATTRVSVYAYRAPTPGAVLYVNRAEAEVEEAQRDRIASLELDEPRNAMRRQGANAKAEQDSQRFDTAKKQLEALVVWRDTTVGVLDASRLLIAADAKLVVAVTGQCVLGIDAAPELFKACEGALATLDPELPAAARVALAIVPTVSDPPPKPIHDTIDDGGGASPTIMRVDPPKPEKDMRPVYLGAGLVVFAALFYWNRKRREKFEREHPSEAPAKPANDEDAENLHSAADAGDDGDRK